jgi:nicotinamidase-related amidase
MKSALIVTDMLNRYEHKDAEPLVHSVREMLPNLKSLIGQARDAEALVVYVNDNYGDWTAGRRELVDSALNGNEPSLIRPILPPDDAPFVVKARHSVFYGTQLEYMLYQHDVKRLIIAGQVTEQCILYSALDAYVRHYKVVIPSDAVAHIHADLGDAALRMMDVNMRAKVGPAAETLASAD